jgi:hypothetical protein
MQHEVLGGLRVLLQSKQLTTRHGAATEKPKNRFKNFI